MVGTPFLERSDRVASSIFCAPSIVAVMVSPGGNAIPEPGVSIGITQITDSFAWVAFWISTASASAVSAGGLPSYAMRTERSAIERSTAAGLIAIGAPNPKSRRFRWPGASPLVKPKAAME